MQAGVGAGGGQLQAGGRGGRQGPGQVEEDDHGAEVQVQEQAYHEAGQSCQLHTQVLLVAKLLVLNQQSTGGAATVFVVHAGLASHLG